MKWTSKVGDHCVFGVRSPNVRMNRSQSELVFSYCPSYCHFREARFWHLADSKLRRLMECAVGGCL